MILPESSRRRPREELAGGVEGAVRALLALQAEDGSFEGEVVWNAMLPSQYVLAMDLMGRPVEGARRARFLRQLEVTQLPDGTWGMHPEAGSNLFLSTLAYVAARTLGVDAGDPLLVRCRSFITREGGVLAIPSWGKLWLALRGLYGWDGVPPVLPELWLLPESAPIHPSRYYCHTRLIYMGMAALSARRLTAPDSALRRALREELYPGQDYAGIDFRKHRGALREGDLWQPPSPVLRAAYAALEVYARRPVARVREPLLEEIRKRMRWELRTTDHTCISPVSGLLALLELHAADPSDAEMLRGLERFEGWIFEDEKEGLRVAGARSATWDTAFALQALAAAGTEEAWAGYERAATWLRTQQIETPAADPAEYPWAYRVDPRGGFCFAGVWHGWPVSDCTAEALEGLGAAREPEARDPERIAAGIRFLLQCQNPDGGFGSYEARKSRVPLEVLNPAEMFGDSMTELSYVECGASCIAALALFTERFPGHALAPRARMALTKAIRWLRSRQLEDGSFPGAWGVAFSYGTWFGIRGLRAGAVPADDPAIRDACAYLRRHQRPDGGWGEHWRSALEDRWIERGYGQVIQTSWAMLGLAAGMLPGRAGREDQAALLRGARFLRAAQLPDGDFPEQDMAGLFFRTALLDYRLYRRFFPLWALSTARDLA